MNVFTSYFAKMAKRKKQDNDFYVSVAHSSYCPMLDLNGIPVKNQIDYNFSFLAPKVQNLDEYEECLDDEDLEQLKEFLEPSNFTYEPDFEGEILPKETNVFLLCYENLNAKYTEKDEEKALKKGCTDIKKGELKKCHRTILAKILKKKYNIDVQEFEQ